MPLRGEPTFSDPRRVEQLALSKMAAAFGTNWENATRFEPSTGSGTFRRAADQGTRCSEISSSPRVRRRMPALHSTPARTNTSNRLQSARAICNRFGDRFLPRIIGRKNRTPITRNIAKYPGRHATAAVVQCTNHHDEAEPKRHQSTDPKHDRLPDRLVGPEFPQAGGASARSDQEFCIEHDLHPSTAREPPSQLALKSCAMRRCCWTTGNVFLMKFRRSSVVTIVDAPIRKSTVF
jgi:hypothetical protein